MHHSGSRLVRAAILGLVALVTLSILALQRFIPPAEASAVRSYVYLPLVHGADPTATPAPEGEWLTRINYLRSLAGVPPIQENPSYSADARAHAIYMLKNNQITHEEVRGKPGYTEEGNAAGQRSNILGSTQIDISDSMIIDTWMASAFHQLGMVSPALREAGYGVAHEAQDGYQTAAVLDVLQGAASDRSAAPSPVRFPGAGAITPLTTFGGEEKPDPLASCRGYQAPTGAPITLVFGRGSPVGKASVSDSSLLRDGHLVDSCAFDQNAYPEGSPAHDILAMHQAVVLIPREPLVPGATYTVSLTVNGTVYTWGFGVAE